MGDELTAWIEIHRHLNAALEGIRLLNKFPITISQENRKTLTLLKKDILDIGDSIEDEIGTIGVK